MAKRKYIKYIDDGYIDKVAHYINNDLPIFDILHEEAHRGYNKINVFNKEYSDQLMLPGAQYKQIDIFDHCIYTNFGRVVNSGAQKQYKLNFTMTTVVIYISSTKISLTEYFEKAGWTYNYDEILDNYNKYDWDYKIKVWEQYDSPKKFKE